MNFDNIPSELKLLKQWVCWDVIESTNSKGEVEYRKVPKNARTGGNARSDLDSTWTTFSIAIQGLQKYHFKGLGFMFANGFFGVDLDDLNEHDNPEMVNEFVETLDSYTEYSPSGNGIHIFCKGKIPDGRKRDDSIGVEMYDTGRFFTVTGNLYDDTHKNISECTEKIKVLHNKYLPQPLPQTIKQPVVKIDLDDSHILQKAMNCRNGAEFQSLYNGHWQGKYDSQSSADQALCFYLAFWTQRDTTRIDRIFRSSGLMRDKWDERRGQLTYGQMTIEKACMLCRSVYEPNSQRDDTELEVPKEQSQQTESSTVTERVVPKTYDMNDTGNANRIADKFGDIIRYVYKYKKWYYWTGKTWEIDYLGNVKKLTDTIIYDIKKQAFAEQDKDLQEALLKFANKSAGSQRKEAMLKEAEHLAGIPILPEDMDRKISLFNCENGIVDLKTGNLLPHDSKYLMSMKAFAEYDTEARKPLLWLKFLDDVTGGDKELQRYLQKCVGYSLTGSIQEQCAFFLYGMGNNGKSTFLETISDVLGSYSANVQPETIMMRSGQNGGANTDIARLVGKRFVISEEPTEGVRLNEGLLKQMTGGGKITARFLFGDEFEYTPQYKIWTATNHKPIIRGTDTGIWRRIRLIPFQVCIPPEKVDKNLKYKLRREFPQILAWAVEGCLLWQQEGLTVPKCVEQATAEYKTEMDILATFVDSCLKIDNVAYHTISAQDLFGMYQAWARANNEFVMTSRKFSREIQQKLPEKKAQLFTGVCITDYGKKYLAIKGI